MMKPHIHKYIEEILITMHPASFLKITVVIVAAKHS